MIRFKVIIIEIFIFIKPMDLSNYKKEKLADHIYGHPDTYVGGCDLIEESLPIWNNSENHIKFEVGEIIPAIYKIYDEIIVNASDQVTRINQRKLKTDIPVTTLKVNINKEKGEVSVYNDGTGIDVEYHPTELDKNGDKIWIPALIFSELLTSINYDKDEKKIVGGKNGYGAKLTNIFSKEFELKTVDHIRGKKYVQKFKNNMKEKGKPIITNSKGKPFTKITWRTDFDRFGIEGYSKFMVDLMCRRVYDIAGITNKSVSVFLNDKKIKINNFQDYSKLYLSNNDSIVFDKISDRWNIGITNSISDKFEQISFVNGIATFKGGKHVDYICKLVISGIKSYILKKHKKTIQDNYIKNYLRVFIDSVIENPSFDSQTKERLISTPSKFGSKPVIDDKYIKNICEKTDIVEKVLQFSEFKLNKENKKTDGSKKSKLRDIPKLDDANWAGKQIS